MIHPILKAQIGSLWMGDHRDLREENRVLKAQLGTRVRLTDHERRRLAVLGARLGCAACNF
jgi:hypothetical protein